MSARLLLSVGTLVSAVVLGGVMGAAGGDVWGFSKGLFNRGSLKVVIVDESYEQIGGSFAVYGDSEPTGLDTCEVKLGNWARERPGSVSVNNFYRVQVTNETADDLVLHEIRPVVASSSPVPPSARQFVCPVGEPLQQRQAIVGLGETPRVSYSNDAGNALAGLSYRLEPGEQGVFYITHYGVPDVDKYLVRWRVDLVYSEPGQAETTLNANDAAEIDDFVSAPPCIAPWSMTNPGEWAATGKSTCPRS